VSKHNKLISTLAIGVAVLVLATGALAQSGSLALPWWKVSGGGTASSAGNFTLVGAVGQPEAGAMQGGNYGLTGGFWVNGDVASNPNTNVHIYLPMARQSSSTPTPTPDCGDDPKNNNGIPEKAVPLLVVNAPCKGTLLGSKTGDDYYKLNLGAGTVVSSMPLQLTSGSARTLLIEHPNNNKTDFHPVTMPYTLLADHTYYTLVRQVAGATDYILTVNTR